MELRRMFSGIREWHELFNYTSDSNDTSFEATTWYAHEPEYTACELKKLTPSNEISSDNSDDEDLDSSRLENIHRCRCKNHCVIIHTLIECAAGNTKTC